MFRTEADFECDCNFPNAVNVKNTLLSKMPSIIMMVFVLQLVIHLVNTLVSDKIKTLVRLLPVMRVRILISVVVERL